MAPGVFEVCSFAGLGGGQQEFMLGSPTPGTLPFPLGILSNPLIPRVTSLSSGDEVFHFQFAPSAPGGAP